MSDLESRLLEFWKADAKEYRRLTNTMFGREGDEENYLTPRQVSGAADPKAINLTPGTCPQCHQEFITANPIRVYCSRRCQRAFSAKVYCERVRAERIAKGLPVRTRRKVTGTMRLVEKNDRMSLPPLAHCAHCGDVFAPSGLPGVASRTFYCSETCRQRAKWHRKVARRAAGARHG
jgi:hypothetical protein